MRTIITAPQNVWYDAQSVDNTDLTLEQSYVNQLHSSLVSNHLGTGIIPEALSQNIIFDSSLSTDLLDGKAITPQAQPTDTSDGNLFEIELTDSLAAGKKTVKIILIGLDFQNNLQYDTLVFAKNEKQITKKHYRELIVILLNDFIGSPLQSFNLGGRLIIREAFPMSVSRDPIMISQDVEPNLVFRDFFVATAGTLSNLLSTALSGYNIDTLNISTGYKQLRSLVENDVSSQIGQKFLSSSDNIQKITLLLATDNSVTPEDLVWTGDLIVSLYALQSTVSSPTDIVPNLAIDFDPTNIPLAQISINHASLYANGIELNTVPQPVDFIFSNTPVGSGLAIKSGYYYVITIKRAGSADTCEIQVAVGNNTATDTRETIFNGSIWTDISNESLWFKVYTDAVKISDGQAYDNGIGVQIEKNKIDSITGITVDYSLDNKSFLRNDLYYAILQAALETNTPVQNERTGNPINSRQQYIPAILLLNTLSLSNIQEVSEPLILATVTDQNIKTSSISGSTTFASFHHYGMVNNEVVFKIIDDSNDTDRYDLDIISLVSDIENGKLNEAKFIPNIIDPTFYYRIAKAELHTLVYGDINGDGIIDTGDLLELQSLLGTNLNILPTADEYNVHINNFVNDTGLSWEIIDPSGPSVITSGTDGIITANGMQAGFQSATANFINIDNLDIYKLKILNSATSTNNSSFQVISLVDNFNIIISKLEYTSDLFLKLLRADIDGDMIISSTDNSYITNHINLVAPFPAVSSPANKIGTTFRAVRLTVERFIDRSDDYPGTDPDRSTTLHTKPDVFYDGYMNWASQDVKTTPIDFSIVRQLNWKEDCIKINSIQKYVPASFNLSSGYSVPSAETNLNTSETFPATPTFDRGKNNLFISDDLIINDGGQIITPSGSYHKIDYEVATISFEIPAGVIFTEEKTVNTLTDFIADYTGTGYTRLGFPAMRFADGSYVSLNGFTNNQIKVGASLLSLSPQLDGYTVDGYSGVLCDFRYGLSINYSTGLLTLQFNNLYQDPVQTTKSTRVQVTVHLKKSGWNNNSIEIDSNRTINLLGL